MCLTCGRPDSAEEADDAEGAEDADDAGGLVGDDERHERHAHDEGVEHAPRVANEGVKPVREGINGELDGEEKREEEVQSVESIGQLRRGAVRVGQVVDELRLGDGRAEILQSAPRCLRTRESTSR